MVTKTLLLISSIITLAGSIASAKTFNCLDAGMTDFSLHIPYMNGQAYIDNQWVRADIKLTYDLAGRPETLLTLHADGWKCSKVCLPAPNAR